MYICTPGTESVEYRTVFSFVVRSNRSNPGPRRASLGPTTCSNTVQVTRYGIKCDYSKINDQQVDEKNNVARFEKYSLL